MKLREFSRILAKGSSTASPRTERLYFVFRVVTFGMLLSQIYLRHWQGAVILLLTLLLYALPRLLTKIWRIEIPSLFEGFIICFIFSAMNLGEMSNFYTTFRLWDTVLHTVNGFLAAGVGLSLVELLNHNVRSIRLSATFIAILTFSFSMTIGVLWEFGEYTADNVLGLDMQKDREIRQINSVKLGSGETIVRLPYIEKTKIQYRNQVGEKQSMVVDGYLDVGLHDTMKDLLVNLLGALVFSVFAYFYESTNMDRFKFIRHFVPKKKEIM